MKMTTHCVSASLIPRPLPDFILWPGNEAVLLLHECNEVNP